MNLKRIDESRLEENMCEIIAYVGAGGKTSSILEEMIRLHQMGKRVVITTTTRMKQPEKIPEGTDRLTEHVKAAEKILQDGGVVWYGHPAEGRKFAGPYPEEWKKLYDLAETILVEADGSKRLPVKIPASHEPVIPDKTDKIIVVMGLSGLRRRIKEVCHRLPLVLELLQKKEDDILTEEDYVKILTEGYIVPLQQKYADCQYEIYLNQANTPELLEAAERIKQKLCQRNKNIFSAQIYAVNHTRARMINGNFT